MVSETYDSQYVREELKDDANVGQVIKQIPGVDSREQTKKMTITRSAGKGDRINEETEDNQINSHNTNGGYATNIGMPIANVEGDSV